MRHRCATRAECLERRRLLSSAAPYSVAAAPPAPDLTDGVLTVNGTTGRDAVRLDIVNDQTVRVAIDGVTYDFPAADVSEVNVQTFSTGRAPLDEVTVGPALLRPVHVGTDRLLVENGDADDAFLIDDFSVTGAGRTVTFGTGYVSISGGEGNDSFTLKQRYEVGRVGTVIHGGAGDDTFVIQEAGQNAVVEGDDGDDALDMNAAVPYAVLDFHGGAGLDRVSCDGTPFSDSVGFTNGVAGLPQGRGVRPLDVELLSVDLGDGDDLATFTDAPNHFSRIEVAGGAGQDALTVNGSPVNFVDDSVSITPGLVHGLGADVAHGGFETLKVDSGAGHDTIDYDVPDASQPLTTLSARNDFGGPRDLINIRRGAFSRPVRIFSGQVENATVVIYPGAAADVVAENVPEIVFNGTEGDDAIELQTVGGMVVGTGSRVTYGFGHPSVTINGLGGADQIIAGYGLGDLTGISIDGGGGDDAVHFGRGDFGFAIPISLAGGGGNDSLLFDDATAFTEGVTFALSGHGLNAFGNGAAGLPIGVDSFEDVTFDDGPKGANVVVTPDESVAFHVHGNDPGPAATPGPLDRIEIDDRGASGEVFTPGAAGAGTFSFANRRPVDFTGMESTGKGIPPAVLTGRSLFYNNSALDGHDPAATLANSPAVIPNRKPLFPWETPVAENVSSYARGINGLFLDFTGTPPAALTAADFEFRVGTGGDTSAWAAAPAPSSVVGVPSPLGANGTRYAVTWPDGAIRDTWLRVTVKAGQNSGLATPDVFLFGNLVGFIGGAAPFVVSPQYVLDTRRWLQRPASQYNPFYDFDRSGRVDVLDLAAVRRSIGRPLFPPTTPPAPAAPLTARAAPARPRKNYLLL
jgi:hypothetical protein